MLDVLFDWFPRLPGWARFALALAVWLLARPAQRWIDRRWQGAAGAVSGRYRAYREARRERKAAEFEAVVQKYSVSPHRYHLGLAVLQADATHAMVTRIAGLILTVLAVQSSNFGGQIFFLGVGLTGGALWREAQVERFRKALLEAGSRLDKRLYPQEESPDAPRLPDS
ncbi:MAG: hypothetical protein AB7N73_15805 [Gemmatimonadales bacterium]